MAVQRFSPVDIHKKLKAKRIKRGMEALDLPTTCAERDLAKTTALRGAAVTGAIAACPREMALRTSSPRRAQKRALGERRSHWSQRSTRRCSKGFKLDHAFNEVHSSSVSSRTCTAPSATSSFSKVSATG